ncbi:MAG: cytochrome c biogenesis CcdA family protein [Clostridia bacterium]|jgi:cytochrome c-type biogenesis protein
MEYFIAFLEGIITFISPCLLPMLPVYVSYFSGQDNTSKKDTFLNSLGFVIGFTTIFVTLGALAGTLGRFLTKYNTYVNILLGLAMILMGLSIAGLFNLPFFKGGKGFNANGKKMNMGRSFVFGVVFSVSWTPCVGAFLGSALMMAASKGESLTGIIMLLLYSIGLGVPFVVSAILIDRIKNTFNFIKRNYKVINIVSGSLLVIFGILLATGLMGHFLRLLSF